MAGRGLPDWLRRRAPAPPRPLDFEAADVVADPYPHYARLRRDEPLHRSAAGAWLLTRYADVAAALDDARLGNAPAPYAVIAPRNRERYLCAQVAGNTLPFRDGAAHRELRRGLAQAWSAQLRERPPDLEGRVRALLAQCRARGHFDLLHEFATPLAVRTIGEVLGVPPAAQDPLAADARYFFYLFTRMPSHDVRAQTDAALARLREGFGRLLEGGAAQGLIGRVRAAGVAGSDRTELLDNLMLLWADGIGNVEAGVASAFAVLLRERGAWRALCEQPALAAGAAAECLRYEPPGQFIGRTVREEIAWHGHTLRAGAAVLLVLASANRDAREFPQPDRFDPRRDSSAALTFGRGRHGCIGGALASLEIETALRIAAQLVPTLRLATATLTWQVRPGHRWLAALPALIA